MNGKRRPLLARVRSLGERTTRVRSGLQAGWKVGTLVAGLSRPGGAPLPRGYEPPAAEPAGVVRQTDNEAQKLHRQYADWQKVRLAAAPSRGVEPPPEAPRRRPQPETGRTADAVAKARATPPPSRSREGRSR